jgi:hypothetical protein
MIRKRLVFAAVLGLMLVSGSSMYSIGFEQDINYYYDDTFATWVGNHYVDCDHNVYDTGTVGSWRIYDLYSCSTGNRVIHRCQQTDGMGGWINVGCPPWDP